MKHVILKSSSLYILFSFFCFVFILNFYDGYRSIYLEANFLYGKNPEMGMSASVEHARQKSYDGFMKEIDFFNDRTNMGSGDEPLDKRHKLRWLYKNIEAELYKSFALVSLRTAIYAKYAHYALWAVVALIFIILSTMRLRGSISFEGIAFIATGLYAYVALVSTVPRMVDQHSIIEMATIAAAIYFSLNRQLVPFLGILIIGVANRETGAGLGMVYALINWRQRLFWLPMVLGPILLAAINIDLIMLPDFYESKNFMMRNGAGYINIFNFTSVPLSLIAFTGLKTFAVLAPVLVVAPHAWSSNIGRKLLLAGGYYLFVLLFGTILGNLFAYALLVPIIFALGAIAYPARKYSA